MSNEQKTQDDQAALLTLAGARERLLALRTTAGFWRGELSSSALSTAVAAVALQQVRLAAGTSSHIQINAKGAAGTRERKAELTRWFHAAADLVRWPGRSAHGWLLTCCGSGICPRAERPGHLVPRNKSLDLSIQQQSGNSDLRPTRELIARAQLWLVAHQNADGGWGDTPASASNLSTTLLAWSALAAVEPEAHDAGRAETRAQAWLTPAAGSLDPEALAEAVLNAYGCDRTFSAPILTICALTGRLGADPWRFVPQLPFALSLLPQALFRFVRLSVVSYALPALIAIGVVRHRLGPRATLGSGWLALAVGPALRVLRRCQPAHGGFLEAAPLNGFVAASLAAAGLVDHPVTRGCARFLEETVRPDGSWPIDTNLSIWLTAFAVGALAGRDTATAELGLSSVESTQLRDWLLEQQVTRRHPFTHAAPGGWGWTDLPGAVPDADDTAGVLLALHVLTEGRPSPRTLAAVEQGLRWLLDLQNSDGGVPTFCRGWGKLPFDRSCPDITAHMLRACDAWYEKVDPRLRPRLDQAMHLAVGYLEQSQQPDGSWLPLWFGNQHAPGQSNPTYGTAQVVRALNGLAPERLPRLDRLAVRGSAWLVAAQQAAGGWGGAAGVAPSIEETALAVTALAGSGAHEAVQRGVAWLASRTAGGTHFEPASIGLYFARLWYAEQLYPVIFAVQALEAWQTATGC